ncbi:MAG TPA: MarR family transcriptional regulator [Acidimicrobiia bacterium]|nr:MarR family transcriptional regulator [Acidimicrobiia bacterium]
MTLRWFDENEERAWRAYRRMFTLLEARLGRELAEETGLSMSEYTVLSNLAEATQRRWRVTVLADYMQWSQSRLSHQLTRMEERGLVRREQVRGDARGAYVVLTKRGLRAIAAATPAHLSGVRRHMIDLLTPEQLATLGDIGDIVVGHLSESEPEPADSRALGGPGVELA